MSDQRQKQWDSLNCDSHFDVVVVGGGINGIGVYRELALQGLRVLLVERNDFCSGCSAAPSRMIHGGLRYLENGEFDLVRESLQERDALLANAPHLVHPLPTVIPIKSLFSGLMNSAASFFGLKGKPSSRGALPIKLGLSLYDWVTRKRRYLPKHTFYSRTETARRWPKLMPDLKFSATFYDAWISHPERLGIELLSDVAQESSNCIALNYAELVPTDNGLSLRCNRGGAEQPIEASLIVNATGAWLDDTIGHLQGNNVQERLVSGTKGSHLIIDNAELEAALNGHMAYFENADGRVCIVFPYLGKVLAGSTDIRVDTARRVRCEPEEEAYILESLKLIFPDIELRSSDIVFSFAGIRPLPKSDHDFTGRISRGHYIKRLEGKILQFCMIGGKWTTFRAFAEQTADVVLKELGKDRKVDTDTIPIGGGRDFPSDISELVTPLVLEFGINYERAERMTKSYGTKAGNILAFCKTLPTDHPLSQTCSLTTGEILYFLRQEHVETISDLILRRTALAISGTLSLQDLDQIIRLFRTEKDLSENRAPELRAEALHELNEFYGVTRQMLESRNKEMELINAS